MGRVTSVVRDLRSEECVRKLIRYLGISYINPNNVRVVRSDSDARVYARVWGVSRVIQVGLGVGPTYVIELINSRFNELSCLDRLDVILHELAHIPRTFSGYVRQHTRAFRRDLSVFRRRLRSLGNNVIKELCSCI